MWANAKPSAYVDVFVYDFLGISQRPDHRRRQVRHTLFHYLYKVFRPYDYGELDNRKELLSLKKLR